MQFPSVKALLRWYYHGFKYKEKPSHIQGSGYEPRSPNKHSRYQNAEDVIATYFKCSKAIATLSNQEIHIVKEYYSIRKKKHENIKTIATKNSSIRRTLERIENKLIEPCKKENLLFDNRYEKPVYIYKEINKTHLTSAKEICEFLNRSEAWFYSKGLKNRNLRDIIKKLDGRWEADIEHLKKWREQYKGEL